MSWIQKQLKKDEGFTLIELMVVVLIIAILIAIAIPTFLGARERAQDRAAQSDLRNSLTAAKVLYTDDEDFSGADATSLGAIEPSLVFQTGAPTPGTNQVQYVLDPADAQVITFVKESVSETVFCIREVATGGAGVAGTWTGEGADAAACQAGMTLGAW